MIFEAARMARRRNNLCLRSNELRRPYHTVQFAKPKKSEQEKALLALGPSHTVLMSISIIVSLVHAYHTEFSRKTPVVFAVLATWAHAVIEARVRLTTGCSASEREAMHLCLWPRVTNSVSDSPHRPPLFRRGRTGHSWKRNLWFILVGLQCVDD